eukprot:5465089-Amphidinium_carterae.1
MAYKYSHGTALQTRAIGFDFFVLFECAPSPLTSINVTRLPTTKDAKLHAITSATFEGTLVKRTMLF